MRLLLAILTVATLAGLALAGDCAAPYRAPVYRQTRYVPPVVHDDVVIFTQFSLVAPAGATAIPTTVGGGVGTGAGPGPAPTPAAAAIPAPLDDGPPVVATAASVSGSRQADAGGPVEVLRANCARCHGNGQKKGGVVIFDAKGLYAPNRDAGELYEAVAAGAMPPDRKLAAAQRKILQGLLAAAR